MGYVNREDLERYTLLPHKEKIRILARSLKAVLDTDVIVVDKYLNRIVNTFQYRYNSANIRINSVVGTIITTQTLQMVYDRKYFRDCVNCPEYATCELGGVLGTPIMCGDECIGTIALLVSPSQLVLFQKKQAHVIDFLQQIAALIANMVHDAASDRSIHAMKVKSQLIFNSVSEAIAVTDPSGVILYANRYFEEFFFDGQPVYGNHMDEVLAHWRLHMTREEAHRLSDTRFYRKGQETLRLRDVQSMGTEDVEPLFLYIFDKLDTLPLLRYQAQSCLPETMEQFFGKSAAMERACQSTKRALRNKLSVLVECPEQQQADELIKLILRHSGQDANQVLRLDCSEDEQVLETILPKKSEGEHGGATPLTLEAGSVLYLYGIDHLPAYFQSRLAQLLSTNWNGSSSSHVRIMATSSQSLELQTKRNRFSRQLYSIISRNKISIPPVGKAPEDVRFYIEKYLAHYCRVYEHPPVQVRPAAWNFLERRHWTGGRQELRETCEYIVKQLAGEVLDLKALSAIFPAENLMPQSRGSVEKTIEIQLCRLLAEGKTKGKIAEELGISRATLYRWIDKYQLSETATKKKGSQQNDDRNTAYSGAPGREPY